MDNWKLFLPKAFSANITSTFINECKHNDVQTATSKTIEQFSSILSNETIAPFVWFRLAELQHMHGCIDDAMKSTIVEYLQDENFNKYVVSKDLEPVKVRARLRQLHFLKNKLDITLPASTDARKRCLWNLGDTYAYQMLSDIARKKGLYGKHLILNTVSAAPEYPNHICPVVRIKITDSDILPTSKEEIDKLEYLYTDKGSKEFMYCPFSRDPDVMKERLNTKYYFDDSGRLPYYAFRLPVKRKCDCAKFKFIGNFLDLTPPKDENWHHFYIDIRSDALKYFEKWRIYFYHVLNLNQHEDLNDYS